MKHIVLFVAALALALGASAQTSLIATLSHNGEVTTYYNSNAFTEAYDAAVDGDVITLSAGTFTAPTSIAKSLTIRGAGMMVEDNPTVLTNIFNAEIKSETLRLNFEGIVMAHVTVIGGSAGQAEFQFTKCLIKEFRTANKSSINFVNCICDSYSVSANNSVTAVNSFFTNMTTLSGNYTNCVFHYERSSSDSNSSFSNCLFYMTYSGSVIYGITAGSMRNCVYIGNNEDFFKYTAISTNNLSFPVNTPIFKEGTNTYELTEENAANWLGSDGTQVGMHGGALPFDPNTTLPKITKFNVASKTTADGKLAVDIEVNVQ